MVRNLVMSSTIIDNLSGYLILLIGIMIGIAFSLLTWIILEELNIEEKIAKRRHKKLVKKYRKLNGLDIDELFLRS